MLCCDEGFSVLGSVRKIFKLGKLNKPQLRKPKGLHSEKYYLPFTLDLKKKIKNKKKTWNYSGKTCGQHCFWLNYRLLIFISSDFSIIQPRKSAHKPRERKTLLPEIHEQLLVFVHKKIIPTVRGQLRFWSKVVVMSDFSIQLSLSLIIFV